jgi:cell division protein FtsX
MEKEISVIVAIATVVFAAGGFFWMAQNTRKQVDGVGRKVNKVLLYLQETATGEERRRLTDILR